MAAQKMKLYYWPEYRSVRIVWLIKEMGVEEDFELIPFMPGKDPDADEEYRKTVHPHCTIPALVIPGPQGRVMLESGAICLYLADRYGKLVPDPEDRQEYYDFAIYGNSTLDELIEFLYYSLVAKMEFPQDKKDKMRAKFRSCMLYLAKHLQDRQFLCGDKFTAADCILGYDLYCSNQMVDGELIKENPEILPYFKRLQERPAYQAATNM